MTDSYTVPGVKLEEGQDLAKELQSCLHNLNDLHLTLKHAHWNVVGPKFIGVHKMLDPQVDAVREMTDAVAERMATMGVPPVGTPGALVRDRDWDDYPIGLAQASEHLGALDIVYTRVIENHRRVIDLAGDVDPITEDILIGQTGEMEQYQWFVRAHLQDDEGTLSTSTATTEQEAAQQAMEGDRRID
ncbi:DNA starvation/stationary phase protection protein [Tessaracoccus antarcticus]|uniref:DNA starvation/stationary phase protection protein n=2 Tax=Tessaracoccus antarcticus TaxID=2479848 RepID=A0A3M0GLB7_9ACTN|nr:DNA starvation/stationary phase protection protein [Tessaracoccus antarcticus]